MKSTAKLYNDAREAMTILAWQWLQKARLRVASWLFGREWYEVVMVLWLIRRRAMLAVKEDGSVILAECQSLADALYAPIPGTWRISVEEVVTSSPGASSGLKEGSDQ